MRRVCRLAMGGLFVAGCAAAPAAAQGALLVSIIGERKVVMMDAGTGRVIAEMPVGTGPHEITVSRDGARAYVAPASEAADAVAVLDLKARTVKGMLPGCARLHDTRISRDGKRLWIACGGEKAVAEVDVQAGKVLRKLDVKLDGGWFVEIAANERKVYVPHLEGKALTVTDLASGTSQTVYSSSEHLGIAASPDGREVWVGEGDPAKLNVVDTASDRVVASVNLPAPVGEDGKAQAALSRIRFTPEGRYVLVVMGTKFLVVDAKTRVVAWSMEMPHRGKVLTVSGDGRRAFVSHPSDDAISVIDLVARKVAAKLSTGKQPDGVAWIK